jgi:hypothetical protein
VAVADRPLRALEQEILDKLRGLRSLAAERDVRIVPIGILPTLQLADFGPACLTGKRRFAALVEQLIARRGRQFRVDINGRHPLRLEMDDVTLEGANTSFQVHYRVSPRQFADTFNAIQAVTPLALAIAGNSPTLFGHCLWQETRIPLFKQSIDTRLPDRYSWNEPARVNFGQGWVRREASELFVEAVRLYGPLLPVCAEELADVDDPAQPPRLPELQLHQSTVWLWNRPVYDASEGGHLRIEMRALPAGPTAADMVANAAMLPVARRGLVAIGIDEASIAHYLGIIERRLATGQTGACWQQSHPRLCHSAAWQRALWSYGPVSLAQVRPPARGQYAVHRRLSGRGAGYPRIHAADVAGLARSQPLLPAAF